MDGPLIRMHQIQRLDRIPVSGSKFSASVEAPRFFSRRPAKVPVLTTPIYFVAASLSRITRGRALTGGRVREPRIDLRSGSDPCRLQRKVPGETEKTQGLEEHRRSLGLKFFPLMNNQAISREQIATCTISEF